MAPRSQKKSLRKTSTKGKYIYKDHPWFFDIHEKGSSPFSWLAEKLRNSSNIFKENISPLFNEKLVSTGRSCSWQSSSTESPEYIENIRKCYNIGKRPFTYPTLRRCQALARKVKKLYERPPPQWEDDQKQPNLRSILKTGSRSSKKQLRFKKHIRTIRLYPLVAARRGAKYNFNHKSYIDIRRQDCHLISDLMDPNKPSRVRSQAKRENCKRYRLQMLYLNHLHSEARTDEEKDYISSLLRSLKGED